MPRAMFGPDGLCGLTAYLGHTPTDRHTHRQIVNYVYDNKNRQVHKRDVITDKSLIMYKITI